MKLAKIRFLGLALLTAVMFFTGCQNNDNGWLTVTNNSDLVGEWTSTQRDTGMVVELTLTIYSDLSAKDVSVTTYNDTETMEAVLEMMEAYGVLDDVEVDKVNKKTTKTNNMSSTDFKGEFTSGNKN